MTDQWVQVRREREALGRVLPSLTEEQWNAPTLCEGWSVCDVVAHQIEAYEREIFPFISEMIHAKGNLDRHNQETLEHIRDSSREGLIARYNVAVDRRTKAGVPTAFVVAETLVHNQDIFRPLQIQHAVPTETATTVADLYRRIGFGRKWRKQHPGVKLFASDTGWEYGDGDVASAPLLSIAMILAGRDAFISDFEGPGAERLVGLVDAN